MKKGKEEQRRTAGCVTSPALASLSDPPGSQNGCIWLFFLFFNVEREEALYCGGQGGGVWIYILNSYFCI